MSPRTHLHLDPALCGRPVELAPGRAVVELVPSASMRADAHELVHGGFVFGLADHAAMLAVNEPTVVLGSSSVRFLAPVAVGERCVAEATVRETSGKKHVVDVKVVRAGDVVLEGEMVCFVPARHVLDKTEAST
jgi:acyl-coenzyme A thioesterase PaaI-like protein